MKKGLISQAGIIQIKLKNNDDDDDDNDNDDDDNDDVDNDSHGLSHTPELTAGQSVTDPHLPQNKL